MDIHLRGLALALLCVSLHPTLPAQTIKQDFSTDPALSGWAIFGDTNLFRWDPTNRDLQVTWDSSQPNSYFYHSLGTILARDDDFTLAFDLRVDMDGPGPDTNKASSFPLAVGFLSLDRAVQTNFLRGTGSDSPDLVELAYFWDSGYGATLWPTFVDTNSRFNYLGDGTDYAIYALERGNWYHVVMTYVATNQAMVTTLTNLANRFTLAITNRLGTNFTDFRVSALSVNSYNDSGGYGSSILALGAVGNIVATLPPPPVTNMHGSSSKGLWQVQFTGRSNWVYTLERTTDFQSWAAVPTAASTANGTWTLADTNTPPGKAFYRVRAQRP